MTPLTWNINIPITLVIPCLEHILEHEYTLNLNFPFLNFNIFNFPLTSYSLKGTTLNIMQILLLFIMMVNSDG